MRAKWQLSDGSNLFVRAALKWTEALTLIHEGHVPDRVYDTVREHFSEAELMDLSLAVVAINSWNCVSIAFRGEAGSFQVPGNAVQRAA